MLSGLDRMRAAERRQRCVAWAWIKARNTVTNQARTTHAKLTSSVLLSSDCVPSEEISNWRDSLAALSHRSLARQICDQFYDISLLAAWRGRSVESAAPERAVTAALPAYCQDAKAEKQPQRRLDITQPVTSARIMTSVLQGRAPQRTAVLIALRSKAAA